jgi:hypothetical protein
MSDCVYHENGPGGDGNDLRGGCRLIRELNTQSDLTDLTSRPEFAQAKDRQEPPHGPWAKRPLQWFFDTCLGWPVRTPQIRGILQRAKVLKFWDDETYDPKLGYDRIYTDEEVQGQTFHVTSEMTQAEKEAQEPACCHYWEQVDA